MSNSTQPTMLVRYTRHAKYYGTELVFETAACEGMPVRDLAQLWLSLREINPKFTSTRKYPLVIAMADAGIDHRLICKQIGVDARKLNRLLTERPECSLRSDPNAHVPSQAPQKPPNGNRTGKTAPQGDSLGSRIRQGVRCGTR